MSQSLRVGQTMDLRGVERTEAYRKARERLTTMAEHDVLELSIDEGEGLRSIPFGLRADGHEILVSEPASHGGVRLLVRKRTSP